MCCKSFSALLFDLRLLRDLETGFMWENETIFYIASGYT